MFADKLLFVEGQVDVGIIHKWAQEEQIELKFNIFGYGVNGWCNFHIFLQISKELGIKKVAVLYDKAKENDKDSKRNNIHLNDDLRQSEELYKDYLWRFKRGSCRSFKKNNIQVTKILL
jgi:predicted ATP-dependent endonuclease of OLD family